MKFENSTDSLCTGITRVAERGLNSWVRYYRLAAEQGYANAQCNLGMCFAIGKGVSQDEAEAEAVRYYRLAAEQGYAVCNSLVAFALFGAFVKVSELIST
jgi:TPR repeat protein